MSVEINSRDAHALRKVTPLSTLPEAHFNALCGEVSIEKQNPGFVLFKRGDCVKEFVYLLEGEVRLQSGEFSIETVAAQQEPVRFPLAHQIPRKIDAVAVTPIRFFRVKIESVNAPSEIYYKYEEEESVLMVTSETESTSGDWMTALLSSPVFQRLPPANLQKVLTLMETVELKCGEFIMQQGDEGDYYYFIREGECAVSRKPSPDAKEIRLAQLRTFDTFGEDALISGKTREATVTASTDMILLRMNKDKFRTLIMEPIMNYMDLNAAQHELQQQTAILVDVREPDAYNAMHIGGSQNIPFFSLRMQLKNFNREQKIVLIDQNGKLSEAAAYLLIKSGFNAAVVNGGVDKISTDLLIGSQSAVVDGIGLSESDQTNTEDIPFPAEDTPSFEALKTENDELREALEKLQQQYQALAADKQKLERNFRLLMAQTDKLKEMLRKLQADGPK